ncbi:hypothetical protein L249_2374, partial [Ophiocordyceps polyrhachis-furcata BCC 54312]
MKPDMLIMIDRGRKSSTKCNTNLVIGCICRYFALMHQPRIQAWEEEKQLLGSYQGNSTARSSTVKTC